MRKTRCECERRELTGGPLRFWRASSAEGWGSESVWLSDSMNLVIRARVQIREHAEQRLEDAGQGGLVLEAEWVEGGEELFERALAQGHHDAELRGIACTTVADETAKRSGGKSNAGTAGIQQLALPLSLAVAVGVRKGGIVRAR